MDKKWKNKLNYAVIFICVFIVPTLLSTYFNRMDSEQFNEWVNEDYEICLKRAKEDSIDRNWCSEIRNASKTTYNSVTRSSNINLIMMLFQPLLFVLFIAVINLKKRIENQEEKLNV